MGQFADRHVFRIGDINIEADEPFESALFSRTSSEDDSMSSTSGSPELSAVFDVFDLRGCVVLVAIFVVMSRAVVHLFGLEMELTIFLRLDAKGPDQNY